VRAGLRTRSAVRGATLSPCPTRGRSAHACSENPWGSWLRAQSRGCGKRRGGLGAFLSRHRAGLESAPCSWVLTGEGQSLGPPQRSSGGCVLRSAASDCGKRWEASASFSPEDFDSNASGLENLSVQVVLSLCSVVRTVLLSHLSK